MLSTSAPELPRKLAGEVVEAIIAAITDEQRLRDAEQILASAVKRVR